MAACALVCVDTFHVQLFQAFELSVTSESRMKAPVTFLTFPNQMILCPCDWVGDRDVMNKLAGLLSEQRPGHIVCAHAAPAERSSLPWQAASVFKETNNT